MEPNTIDRRAAGFEGLDEVEHGGGFGAAVFDVVVVDVEFGVRVGSAGGAEGDVDVGSAENVVEDV